MDDRKHPFSNGTQYMDWTSANCERCTKAQTYDKVTGYGPFTCETEEALAEACLMDGSISPEIATRMAMPEDPCVYQWKCGEWEPTEEWKAEVEKKRRRAGEGKHD